MSGISDAISTDIDITHKLAQQYPRTEMLHQNVDYTGSFFFIFNSLVILHVLCSTSRLEHFLISFDYITPRKTSNTRHSRIKSIPPYFHFKGNKSTRHFFKTLSIIFTTVFHSLSETLIISQIKSWVSHNNRKYRSEYERTVLNSYWASQSNLRNNYANCFARADWRPPCNRRSGSRGATSLLTAFFR